MKISIYKYTCAYVIIFVSNVLCQINSEESNTIYLELGGNNIIYSINYEKEIYNNIAPRIGFSIIPHPAITKSGKVSNVNVFATAMANYFVDLDNNNKIELGAGFSYGLGNIFSAITIGYRHVPDHDGIIYKIAFTPLVDQSLFDVFVWFGIGVGYRF